MAKILIIDDDHGIIEVVKMFLESEGHDLTSYSSAEEAIVWVKNNPIDLLITDILMPEMSGLELISEIGEIQPGLKILAISGGGETGGLVTSMALDTAMDLGAQKALPKPFTKEELVNRVNRLLN